jgi:hypothetical protein
MRLGFASPVMSYEWCISLPRTGKAGSTPPVCRLWRQGGVFDSPRATHHHFASLWGAK